MSRVFRRPMFRRGGEVGGGIMTGIRSNFKEGTPSPSERIQEALKKFEEPAFDPLAQLLIQGGLRGMSQTGGGSTLGNLAKAFEKPTTDFFKARQAKKDVDREVALAGVEADIGADLEQAKSAKQAEIAQLDRDLKAAQGDADRQNRIAVKIQEGKNEIAELQFKKDNPEIGKEFAAQTPEEQFKVFTNLYLQSNIPPIKNNAAVLADFRLKHSNQGYYELNYNYSNKSKKYEPDFSAIPIGGLTYDPTQGKAFRRNKDGSFTELNPFDLSPLDADGTE